MRTRLCPRRLAPLCLLIFVLAPLVLGQNQSADEARESKRQSRQPKQEQLNMNWLYGAYVPKEAALVSLTVHQRQKLFMRQTFTTPGIYIKSGFLALLDQASGEPYAWGGGLDGYGRRVASNYARTAIQNAFSTAGKAALRYEPRYDRSQCAASVPEPSTLSYGTS